MVESIKLNLGSGPRANAGWICIDRSPNVWLSRSIRAKRVLRSAGLLTDAHMTAWDSDVVRGDVRKLKFADNTVDAVYSSHTLEHLHLHDARRVLEESRRVLKPGGIIRLALPDVTSFARKLVDDEDAGKPDAGHQFNASLLAHPESKARGLRALMGRVGGHTHYWQPTPSMAIAMLTEAGFREIGRYAFRQGRLPDLERVETRDEGFYVEGIA